MHLLKKAVLLLPLLALTACGSEAGAGTVNASSVTDMLGKASEMLSGITDKASAEAVKPELSSITDKIGAALKSLTDGASDIANTAGEVGGEGLGKAAGDLMDTAKSMLPAELTSALTSLQTKASELLGNQDIAAAIGPILEKIKGFSLS